MSQVKFRMGDVTLPHIAYTVRFRKLKRAPDSIPAAVAYIERDSSDRCTIYLSERGTPCTVAHEIVHALQYICKDRYMDFTKECEHTAYMMQHLMGFVLNYEWV
jgi:hypothetical protein